MSLITAPVGEVTTPMTDGQEGQGPFARRVEQALGRELWPPLLEQGHQRADAGRLDALDDELVLRAARIGGQPAGADHLQPVGRLERELGQRAAPRHRVDQRLIVLEREVEMSRGSALESRQLAAHAHEAIRLLDRPLQREGELGDGVLGEVVDLGQHGRGVAAPRGSRQPFAGIGGQRAKRLQGDAARRSGGQRMTLVRSRSELCRDAR